MTPSTTSAAARSRPRPTCTHLEMERIYTKDDTQCPHCGRVPLVGFLYECRQDLMPIPTCPNPYNRISTTTLTNMQRRFAPKNKKRNSQGLPAQQASDQPDIEAFNLSPWLTKAIKDGHYLPEQIEKIKAQRVNVLTTIVSSTLNRSDSTLSSTPPTKISLQDPGSSATAFGSSPKANIRAINAPQPPGGCDFRCCPTCRPLSRDRTFASFENAYARHRDSPLTESDRDPRSMRVDDIHVVRGLGMKVPPPPLHRLQHADAFTTSSMESNESNASSLRSDSDAVTDIDAAIEREDDDLDIDDGDSFPNDEDDNDGPYIDASSGHPVSPEASPLSLALVPERASMAMPPTHSAIRSSASGVAFAESLKAALKETVRRYLGRSSNDEVDNTFNDEIERMSQDCDTGDKFDIGRWRDMSEALLVRVANTKAPIQHGDYRLEEEGRCKDARMTEDVHRDENLGVELTEEAVDTHSPDVITQV